MTEVKEPNYKKIFEDIIAEKCPERSNEFSYFLQKEKLSIMNVIELNNRIFGKKNKDSCAFNQKHKSYNLETILQILAYQNKEELSNIQLANHFNLSRNTVTKWRRLYNNL